MKFLNSLFGRGGDDGGLGGERPEEQRCVSCDTPMNGGVFTAEWEDGDNEDAYVTCPSCGYQNFV